MPRLWSLAQRTNNKMTTEQFLASLEATYKYNLEVAKKKNADYAGEGDPFRNFKNSLVVGVPVDRAILVRIMDKISRISNLLDKEAQVKDEALTDSIGDCINYLAILKALIESEKMV